MAYPFLDVDQLAEEIPLDDAQKASATRQLQIVSDWIRAHAPDASDEAGQQVVFEVVRDSLNLGEFAPLKQFENTTSRRTQAGTFVDAEASSLLDEVITDRQKRLLGIPLRAAPAFNFPCNDLAMPHEQSRYGFYGRGPYGQVDYY